MSCNKDCKNCPLASAHGQICDDEVEENDEEEDEEEDEEKTK